MSRLVLSRDVIDEAQVRFARSSTDKLARYIERETLRAVGARNGLTIAAKKQLSDHEKRTLRDAIECLERDAERYERLAGDPGESVHANGYRSRAATRRGVARRLRALLDRLSPYLPGNPSAR